MAIDSGTTQPRSRRTILAGALGGVAGLIASRFGTADSTKAASGDPLILGVLTNNSGTTGTKLSTNGTDVGLYVQQNGTGTALAGSGQQRHRRLLHQRQRDRGQRRYRQEQPVRRVRRERRADERRRRGHPGQRPAEPRRRGDEREHDGLRGQGHQQCGQRQSHPGPGTGHDRLDRHRRRRPG